MYQRVKIWSLETRVEAKASCRLQINHSIPNDKLNGIMALARKFFDLPIKDQMAAALMGSKYIRRYMEMSGQTLEPETAPDLKEGLTMANTLQRRRTLTWLG